jgi:hypothetical protein
MDTVLLAASAKGGAPDFLTQTLAVVQIIFFSIPGLVAFLSYITAKRTIFQPLRTEIFKKQIEDLSSILSLLSGKGEVDLRQSFAFKDLIQANIAKMYDAYAKFAFNIVRPEQRLEYRPELCPTAMVLPEALKLATEYRTDDVTPAPKSDRAEEWDYVHYTISIPRAFTDKEDEFKRIFDSPLLPQSIVGALERYLSVVRENAVIVSEVIQECAKEMPEKYPQVVDIEHASYSWIDSRINERLESLEPVAKLINRNAREYFDADNLLPARNRRYRLMSRARRLTGRRRNVQS